MAAVILNELSYIGDTSLALILIVMAASIGVIAYTQLKNYERKYRPRR